MAKFPGGVEDTACLSMLCTANAAKADPISSSSHLMLGMMSGSRKGPLVTAMVPNPLAARVPSSPLLLVPPHGALSPCPAGSSKLIFRVQPTGSLLVPDEFH